MPAPRVSVQRDQICNEVCAKWVQMDVTDQFPEIRVLFADNGLVSVLEQMPVAAMPLVEGDGVPGKEAPHEPREPRGTTAEEHVSVIREDGPRVDPGARLHSAIPEPPQELDPIHFILNDVVLLYTPKDDVVECPWSIQTSLPRHTPILCRPRI